MATPALDPNQSFTVTDESIDFDPAQPFDLEVDEVAFDPSQPFEAEPETGLIEGVAKSATRGAVSEGLLAASEGVYRAGAATVRPFDRDAYLNQEIASAESEIQSLLNNKMMISDAREAGIRGQQERIDRANTEMQARLTPGTPEFNERQSVESATSTGIADTLTGFADEAKNYREAVREALPISQNFKESLTGQVAQGLGQLITVPAYAVPGLGQAVSIGQLYQEAYDDAVNSGANLEQAERAAFQYTAGAAPLEILADKLLVGKALKGMSGKLTIGQAAKEVAKMSAQEGATEGAQQALLNVVANNLTGYDPDRPLDDGVVQSVIVAGLVGGGGATIAQGAGYLSRDTQNQPSSIPKLPVDETGPDANSGFNRMKRAINNDPERFQELYGEAGRQAAETFAKPSLKDWRNAGTSAAETVKQEKVTTLDAAAVNANENSSPLVAQELSKQADTLQSTPAPIVAPEAAEIDRQARTLEILEDLDQEEAGLQTEVQGDERFAPQEPPNAIRQAQIEADNLYSEDPDQAGQSSLRDWRLTLPPEVSGNIQAHGAPISELQGILEQGIDQSRPFYTAPLNESGEASLGLRDIGTGGQVLVLSAPGQDIKQSGVQAVVVNDYLAPSVPQLQEAYPNVTWLTTQNATQWLNEQQPTRLDESITIPQGQAQTPQAGIAPEVQESPVTQTQGEINALQIQSPAEGLLRPEIQEPQQQVGLQGVQQGNQLQETSQQEVQVNEQSRNDSGSIPKTIQPTVEEGTGESSQVAPRATPRRVQIGSSPQTHEVISELPQSQREQELGERYFRIRNERTGEEQTVEAGDMRPVKGKAAEDALKPEIDQTKERLNALTPAQKESVLSLNNNSGSVLIPDFQDLQQAVQSIASSLNQAYDNFTDWSGAMVRSFGNDIVRFLQRIYNILNTGGIDYLPGRENSGSILNPAGMFSKSTRQPFRKVQKDKKYKPEGIWSAAGKWNKQIFDFLGQKERNVSANLNATEFLAAKLQRERRKAEKEGIDISTETLNTALGNTDNRLTDAQYAQARQIRNPQARANFERTAKLQNYDIARQAQAAALQSLPQDIQETINEMRNRVDQLSSELRDSGAVSGDIKASIDDAMGLYLHRSYSIFDNAEGWKNFIYSDDPEAVAIRNRAETLFQDYARAEAASQLIRENKEAGTPITRQEAIDQVKDLDVTEEAGLILEDYLSVADKGEQSILGGRIVGQKNRSILKMRGQIPEEIQDLWGEQKDATANFAKTYAGMSSFLENHRFLENVLQEGLITEQNPDGYIWKEGESPGNRPRAYTQLVGDGSKSMEPLNGAWMPPELAQAFTEYYGKRGDQNAVLRLLQAATGLSMKSKTAYSLASTIRNFVGNIAFMTANGNFNVSKLSDAQKSAWSNLTKGGEKAIRDRIENYIRLGVVGDNVGPKLIKEISEAANLEKTSDKIANLNPILTKILRGFRKVDRKATDIYSSVDDFWKVFAFENELNKIKRAYPNETQAQQEQRAANVVRSTVPTYSLAPEIVRNLKSNFGVAVAPFITFTTEVVRTTYNTVRQGVTEIREGNATNNQELRNIGIQRLASFAATQSIFPALGIIFKELFDYDDEDEDAVRRFLPDWQKNAQLLLLPPDEKGNPRYIDVSFLDPYGYLKEPLIAAAVQSRSGKSTDQIALDASLASLRQIAEPFISEQILAGSIADIVRNTTASGAEVYNPQDNIANIAGKAVLHVASSFEPGTYASLNRIYKGVTEQVSPTGRAYDTPSELSSLFLGQRVSSLDPQTSLDFASRRFKGENQDSTSLFTRPFKSRGTIGENAVSEGYQSANEAKQRNVQSLRDAYKAALTLGVPEKTARRILDDASIGQDAMREVISGVYRRYQPSTQSMNEVRKKNPERIQQLQQAISSTPATVPLR